MVLTCCLADWSFIYSFSVCCGFLGSSWSHITSCCHLFVSYSLTCVVGGSAHILCLFWYSETAFSLKCSAPVLRCTRPLSVGRLLHSSVSCWLKGTRRTDEGLGSSASSVGRSGFSCLFLDFINAKLHWTWFQVCSVPGGCPWVCNFFASATIL